MFFPLITFAKHWCQLFGILTWNTVFVGFVLKHEETTTTAAATTAAT